MNILDIDVGQIKGVGPQRSKALKKIGISTLEDLLLYIPRTYQDLTNIKPLFHHQQDENLVSRVRIVSMPKTIRKKQRLEILKIYVEDESGKAACIWYNQPFVRSQCKLGAEYLIWGKAKYQFGELQIVNPAFIEVNAQQDYQKILPVYPLTGSFTHKIIRTIIKNALEITNGQCIEPFPEYLRKQYHLSEINYAYYNIHFPSNMEAVNESRRRLVFEELFCFHLALKIMHRRYGKDNEGIYFKLDKEHIQSFIEKLPFTLTNAQEKVLNEVLSDMKTNQPMNRLIQGDVGSGKTAIIGIALLNAVHNHYQGAFMVPTEILADQHFKTLTDMFMPYNIRIGILKGSLAKKQRENALAAIQNGDWDIVIGTHALLQDDVRFKQLGLVITDEQHRFGVRQRAQIYQKGCSPDVLVVSATPIPRTLGLILYGDLDVSVIDELPPGRKAVKTYHISPPKRSRMYDYVIEEICKGSQAYIVCPLVEESEHIEAYSAEQIFFELKRKYGKDVQIGLLHGKMKNVDKEKIMNDFIQGNTKLLVSTTVIEVGVNVPNATMMVIENADRFGLAQLHQLRGRVGRGTKQSYCFLVSSNQTEIAKQRMQVITQTNDGFEIAEQDLKIRGPGDFIGTRQHGMPDFKIADIAQDMDSLIETHRAVSTLLENCTDNEVIHLLEEIALKRFYRNFKNIAFN